MEKGRPLEFRTPDGLKLVGTARGPEDGPLVMLMHGGGQTRHAWTGTANRLAAAGFHVVCYDARGHGDSDWSASGEYSMEAHGADLRHVIGEIGRPAALAGASMGGIAALLAAHEAPERVTGLILVDIVPRFAKAGVERVRAFMLGNPEGFATIEEAAAAVQAYNPARSPKNPERLMRNLREGEDGRLRWHWDPAVIGSPPDPQLSEMLTAKLAGLPSSLPLLLISGAQSDVVDAEATEEFRRQAPHAEIVAINQAGHMVAGDRNDAFGDAIEAFLRKAAAT